MSATPDQRKQLPEPAASLPTSSYCTWINGRDERLIGEPPHLPNSGSYMDGYLAASAHLEANKPDTEHAALRMCFENQTQLASIADAVRQLSSRVSEMEHQLRGIAVASNPEPDKPTAQRGIAAADPALELWAIAVDLNSAANRFREKHRHEWTFTDSTADSISRYAHKIESLSSNFQKPSTK